jgi:hopanoid biosynthesis associated radical SAM protein HpnH
LKQQIRVGAYILKQRLLGRGRYPLVLMLEPLFRCNLACPGCGKIDYPDAILNRRLSVEDCIRAVEDCPAPVVSIPGGEPLLHKEIGEIVAELVKRKRFVYLCTNALLLEKRLDLFEPSDYLTLSVHLDGLEAEHDVAVAQAGVFRRAVGAIQAARARGFRVTVNCTLFNTAAPEPTAAFFDFVAGLAYERAPDQAHFLSRRQTKELFREVFRLGRGRKWRFSQSSLFLDFLAGNQAYRCTPWSNPTRNIFGWQRPCYLLNEGYAGSFRELMERSAPTAWSIAVTRGRRWPIPSPGRGRRPRSPSLGFAPRAAWRRRFLWPISARRSSCSSLWSIGRYRTRAKANQTRPAGPRPPIRQRRLASAASVSRRSRSRAGTSQGLKHTPRTTWPIRGRPSGPMLPAATRGRGRSAGSAMARTATKGTSASAATPATA